jgi:hypothetical protein
MPKCDFPMNWHSKARKRWAEKIASRPNVELQITDAENVELKIKKYWKCRIKNCKYWKCRLQITNTENAEL